MKRIFLFLATNIAVLLVLSITMRLLGIESILDEQGDRHALDAHARYGHWRKECPRATCAIVPESFQVRAHGSRRLGSRARRASGAAKPGGISLTIDGAERDHRR